MPEEKVRKMKGLVIDAKKMKKTEDEKSEKVLKKVFEDNSTGRYSGPTDD